MLPLDLHSGSFSVVSENLPHLLEPAPAGAIGYHHSPPPPPPPALPSPLLVLGRAWSTFEIVVNSSAFCLTVVVISLDSTYLVEPHRCGLKSLVDKRSEMGDGVGGSHRLCQGLG